MISLDGSTLEGGGQLVRVAVCLSAITGVPLHVYGIRANRAAQHGRKKVGGGGGGGKVEGGLKESHLAAVQWLAEMCGARVAGAGVGSKEVWFEPGGAEARRSKRMTDDEVTIELEKPGSVWLVLQALLPYLVFCMQSGGGGGGAEKESGTDRKGRKVFNLRLVGGTNVSKSMSGEYVQQVLLPNLRKIGVGCEITVEVRRRGWAGYASEMGEVIVSVAMERNLFGLEGFEARERGEVRRVMVNVVAGGGLRDQLRDDVVTKLAEVVNEEVEVEVVVDEDSGDERRLYVLLVAETSEGWGLGRDYLGSGRKAKNENERNAMVKHAVKTVIGDLIEELKSGACVDEHMEDQLVVWQALAKGRSSVHRPGEGSLHTRTVRWVCDEMLRDKGLSFDDDGACEGIAWHDASVEAAAGGIGELSLGS